MPIEINILKKNIIFKWYVDMKKIYEGDGRKTGLRKNWSSVSKVAWLVLNKELSVLDETETTNLRIILQECRKHLTLSGLTNLVFTLGKWRVLKEELKFKTENLPYIDILDGMKKYIHKLTFELYKKIIGTEAYFRTPWNTTYSNIQKKKKTYLKFFQE